MKPLTGILALGALAAAGVAFGPGLLAGGGDDPGEPAAAKAPPAFHVPVTFAEVRRGDVEETVELVGDVASNRRAVLAFERAGRVEKVLADLGDRVEEGQVLAQLDDGVLRQDLAVARAQAAGARTQADYAAREATRAADVGADAVSESERDQKTTEAGVQRRRFEQMEASVRRLEELLKRGELRAPFPAVVTARGITDGSYTAAGNEAFVLLDLDRREVHLEIPAPIAAGLAAGAPVALTVDSLPGFRLETALDLLVPAADPQTRTFRGIVRLFDRDPERKLLPGMFVRARIVRRRVSGERVVPADALVENARGISVVRAVEEASPEGGKAVRKEPESKARFVPVRVLARNDREAAVGPLEDGALSVGDRVVVTGVDNVFPGAPLSLHAGPSRDPGAGG